ncbi:MAG: hypothetical protein JNL30_17200 [Rubrivivax sp.]|nr:hypothetical protein [Rubrivivax sp.]
MNAPWSPEVLLRPADDAQAPLPLGADGVARWVWQSRFGAMLIEVIDGAVFVNGDRVQPHVAAPAPAPALPLRPAGSVASGPGTAMSHRAAPNGPLP